MSEAAWRIDALDPVGGLCFAALRPADLEAEDEFDLDLDGPAVHLGPPAFQPEIVGSRAAGFAATRGRFQLGLFVGEVEVAFPTLEALTEFVRRCYLSGGGTDGGGGRTPVPPPRLPDGGGEAPDLSRSKWPKDVPDGERPGFSEARSALGGLLAVGPDLADRSEHLGAHLDRTAAMLEEDSAARLATLELTEGDVVGLGRVAAMVMAAMVEAVPPGTDSQGRYDWIDAVGRLGEAVTRLGLWDIMEDSMPGRSLGQRFARRLDAAGSGASGPWHGQEDLTDGEFLYRIFGGRDLGFGWSWGRHATDPMDDLASWPVPPRTVRDPAVLTLRDLLSAVAGTPGLIDGPVAAALTLLAAAHSVPMPWPPGEMAFDRGLRADLRREHLHRALNWLGQQFPSHVFRPELEAMIGRVGR